MIKGLNNPKTAAYIELKNRVCSADFPWYFIPKTTHNKTEHDLSWFCHTCLERPERDGNGYSVPTSPYCPQTVSVVREILQANSIELFTMLRACFNMTTPQLDVARSVEHVDHDAPHQNLIIYLNDCDGDTVVEGESVSPEEDKVILLKGSHYIKTPTIKERVVLVATFIAY